MKSYTDLEQSKKLAEILPLESADMYYAMTYTDAECNRHYNTPARIKQDYAATYETDIPCWSLASLLSVLPNYQLQTQEDGIGILCSCKGKFNIVTEDNPIDACYELILKLNELNLL